MFRYDRHIKTEWLFSTEMKFDHDGILKNTFRTNQILSQARLYIFVRLVSTQLSNINNFLSLKQGKDE